MALDILLIMMKKVTYLKIRTIIE